MIKAILTYLRESTIEFKKVNWLSWHEVYRLTIEVLLFSAFFGVIYGLLDFIFIKLILLK
jgi:preprotein translocase SecE subunit